MDSFLYKYRVGIPVSGVVLLEQLANTVFAGVVSRYSVLMMYLQYLPHKTYRELYQLTPSRTGFLKSSLKLWDVSLSPTGLKFTIGWRKSDFVSARAYYPAYVELGTGIYVGRSPIRPKRAKALRFETEDGRIVITRQVRGQKGQQMLFKAITSMFNSLAKEAFQFRGVK